MNETQKTGIFAAIAAAALLLAFLTRPVTVTKEDEAGQVKAGDLLFKDEAADATKAASLKITKFDENKLSMDTFEITRDKQTSCGVSHRNTTTRLMLMNSSRTPPPRWQV